MKPSSSSGSTSSSANTLPSSAKQQQKGHMPVEELSIEQMKRQLKLQEMQVNSLQEVTMAINKNLSASELFRIFEFNMLAQLGVQKLLMFYNTDNDWKAVCSFNVKQDILQSIKIKDLQANYKNIVELSEKDAAYLQDFEIIVPVVHDEEPLAYALLGDIRNTGYLSMSDKIKFIQTVSNIIVVAVENKRLFKKQLLQERLNKDLELAEQVQGTLVPRSELLPNTDALQMAATYIPHRNISGDYYDYIPLNKDNSEFLVCMADVSGKGIAAALLMANFQGILRTYAANFGSVGLSKLLILINKQLISITQGARFITVFLAHHNLKKRSFTYINAGHNPPLLLCKDKPVQWLKKGSTVLGAVEELPYIHETTLRLPPQSNIITYTDGLTDLENEQGEYYETERLKQFTEDHMHLPMHEFVDSLLNNLHEYKGKKSFTDDVSILSYRIL